MSPVMESCYAGNWKIPLELFRTIVQYLRDHRSTLAALALTSSSVREDVLPALYGKIDTTSASDTELHVGFLSSIARSPKLATFVHEYHSIDVVDFQETSLWDLFNQALSLMTNLKVLHLRFVGGHPSAALLLDAPFQLSHLHWENHCEDAIMSTVLIQQKKLEYLFLQVQPGTAFPSECCAALRELAGNRATLDALLPARRIERISWVPGPQDVAFDGNATHLASALRHVKWLSLGTFHKRPHLKHLVDYLDRLENLELVGFRPDEIRLLHRLVSLRELIFSFDWDFDSRSLPSTPGEPNEHQNLVSIIFSSCPSLRYIEIARERISFSEIRYEHWTRDRAQQVPDIIVRVYVNGRRVDRNEEYN